MSQKKVTGLRLDDAIETRLSIAVEKMSMPKSDVMRLALDQGLRDFADINYDLGKAIHDRVVAMRKQDPPEPADQN